MAGGESGEYEILLTRHTGQMAECAWHITWTVQEFWGFKTTLTLTPISPMEEHFQHPQRKDPGLRLQRPQSTILSRASCGFLLHRLNCEQLSITESNPPSCAHLRWDRRLLSQFCLFLKERGIFESYYIQVKEEKPYPSGASSLTKSSRYFCFTIYT